MEKKNLIIREKVDDDARLKKLSLTEEAKNYARDVLNDLKLFEDKITKDIKDDDLDTFISVLEKIENNLRKD
jgi:DNA-binding MarR family transcriptional regulator